MRTLRTRLAVAAGALGVLVLPAYAYYYLDSLPQAAPLDPPLDWRPEPGQEMRLEGIAPGSYLHFDLRGSASASLSLGKGAVPNPALPAGVPVAEGVSFRLYAVQSENISVMVELTGGDGRGVLHVEPGLEEGKSRSVWLRAEGAGLKIDLGTSPSPRLSTHSKIGAGPDEIPLQEATVTLPAGVPLEFRATLEHPPSLENPPYLKVEPGLDSDPPGFRVRAVEIGRAGPGAFERRSMACGSTPNRLLWQRPAPAVRARDCEAGHLLVTEFKLDKGAAVSLEGSGFVVRDGRTNVWQGFRDFRQNDVVRTALGVLLAGMVGWAFLTLRGGRKAVGGGKSRR